MSNSTAASAVTPTRIAAHRGHAIGRAKWLFVSMALFFKKSAGHRLAGDGTNVLYLGM